LTVYLPSRHASVVTSVAWPLRELALSNFSRRAGVWKLVIASPSP
jgi:hypothetical protein